jgi:molybdopterin-guanine dinucleotide biosynthesis protein MobB
LNKITRILSVVGFKKSGKTKVVEGLVRELSRRNYDVGTLKHIPDQDFTIDQPGKDSWKHAEAGAKKVVIISPRETVAIEKRQVDPEDVLRSLSGLDFIILEGFRNLGEIARIAVLREQGDISEMVNEFTIACVGPVRCDLPSFDLEDLKAIAGLVEQKAFPVLPQLDCQHCGYPSCRDFGLAVIAGEAKWDGCTTLRERAMLEVDGKRVPLNPFVQELVAKVIEGITSSLKQAGGKEIVMKVRRSER